MEQTPSPPAPSPADAPSWPAIKQRSESFLTIQDFLKSLIRDIPDYPKPGVVFPDVTTLLLNPEGFKLTIDAFARRYADSNITHVASCESRGFIFGAPLALALNCAFVPVRKAGKLPGPTVGVNYSSRFQTDRLEIHRDALPSTARVLIIDDMMATGGTLVATAGLIKEIGANTVECAVVFELPEFGGRRELKGVGVDLFCLLDDEEENEDIGGKVSTST